MPRGLTTSTFMKPFVVLALPGMYLFYKYNQYRRQQQEQNRRKVTERELAHLNHKIDKLLTKLEENEPELATSQEDECVICVNAKATMQTSPCGHRVVCRKCFVKTIQMAVSQRLLPLRCVICRAKILRLKQSGVGGGAPMLLHQSASQYAVKSWAVPSSASQYSMGSVPPSASLYSMSSGSSSLSGSISEQVSRQTLKMPAAMHGETSVHSTKMTRLKLTSQDRSKGVSSVSSATNSSHGSSKSSRCAGGSRLGYPRQPTGSLRRSQAQAMKLRIQEYKEPVRSTKESQPEKAVRLPPIKEFQREYRAGKERTSSSSSTRIRCAQKIVTQLETTPPLQTPAPSSSCFRPPLKPANKDDKRKPGDKPKDEKKADDKGQIAEKKKEDKQSKKSEKKEAKADKKPDKKEEKKDAKADKKESKSEKKEAKKEAKAEKKESKKEAKADKKKDKKEAKAEKKD